jgi:hypothetical protein
MSAPDNVDGFADLPLREQLGRLVGARLEYHREYGRHGRWPDHPGDEQISSLQFMAGRFVGSQLRQSPEHGTSYGPSNRFDLYLNCDWTEYRPGFQSLKSNRSAIVRIDFAFIERLSGSTSGGRRCHLITGYGPNYLLALTALATTLGPGFRQIRCMTYWEPVRTTDMTEIDGGLERLSRLLGLEIASEKRTVTYPYLQPDGTSKTREMTTIAMGVEFSCPAGLSP